MVAMVRHVLKSATVLMVLGGCSADPGPAPDSAPTGPAERSEVVFQAVDAGTGGALNDAELTVRYLVRYPVTLDAADVVRVASAEPHRIAHEVSADSMVVELRLEAGSYHRLDTVLSVAKGATTNPLTVRMARRLERTASTAPCRATPASGWPSATWPCCAPSAPLPSRTTPCAAATPAASPC